MHGARIVAIMPTLRFRNYVDAAPARQRAASGAQGDISPVTTGAAVVALTLALFSLSLAVPERFSGERGIVESLQAALLAGALYLSLRLALKTQETMLRLWLLVIGAGLLYLFGEEISWGQHWFGWGAEGWFAAHNDQQETNLHNTSTWLDQKPRALLVLAVFVGGIVHPALKAARGRGLFERPWWLAPTLAATPFALAAFLAALPERLPGLDAFHGLYRESELEELFVYAFLLTYLLSLAQRLPAQRRGRAVAESA